MPKLDVGIVGAGLITQVEHLPNLLALPELFNVVGVADPSQKVRAHLSRRWSIDAFATADELFARELDAVVIATPDAYHVELVLAALERGFHVFVEKPLCYAPDDAAAIAAARDRAGRIVQVGYMKRFDPAVRQLRTMLVEASGPLRSVTVEVIDPDAAPFVAHRELLAGDDIAQHLIAENSERRAAQIERGLGFAPDTAALRGFAGPYCSSLVHDLNLVRHLVGALGIAVGEPVGAAFFGEGAGGYAAARLTPGDALMTMTWVAVQKLALYSERISLVFDDAAFEIRFPSPYLNHQQTELVEHRSTGLAHRVTRHEPSYAEGFVEELKAWHAAITAGGPVLNPVEDAAEDIRLFTRFARLAVARPDATPNATPR